jgi:hypothetical protein
MPVLPLPRYTDINICRSRVPISLRNRAYVKSILNTLVENIPLYKYTLIESILTNESINTVLMYQFLEQLARIYHIVGEVAVHSKGGYSVVEEDICEHYVESIWDIWGRINDILFSYMNTPLEIRNSGITYTNEIKQFTYSFYMAETPMEVSSLADRLIRSRDFNTL